MSQQQEQAQLENSSNDLLLHSLEPNTNSVPSINGGGGTGGTSHRLPLRKRIGPILKWQPVETPDEHYKSTPSPPPPPPPPPPTPPPATITTTTTTTTTTPATIYPQHNQSYPLTQHEEVLLEDNRSESSDQEFKMTKLLLQKKIKQENGIKRSKEDDNSSIHSNGSSNGNSRPTKKVKRGRPPLQKNGSSNTATQESLPTTPTTPSTPAAVATLPSSLQRAAPPLPPSTATTTDTIDTSVLYCICKRPYDVPRFMIACDKCNEWFHGECIQISEKQGEFIDLYFCEPCAKITGKKTSWKPQCANASCGKAARIGTNQGHLSKYCSDLCGMQVARTRIEQAEQKKRQAVGPPTPTSTTTPTNTISDAYMTPLLTRSKLCSFADMDDRSRLIRVKDEKLHAKFIISIGQHKSTLLDLLLKYQKQDVCGFDSRLSWPDNLWERVAIVEEEEGFVLKDAQGLIVQHKNTVCQQQGKCNKHFNWQKLKLAELDQERSEQFVILTMLERERQQIKARMKKRREEVDLIDFLENGTVYHSSSHSSV